MSQLSGLPPDQVDAEVDAHTAKMTVDESVYPLDAIYGATFTLLDRCYVLLDRAAPGRVRIALTPKNGGGEAELRALAGELSNELLSCAWRAQIVKDNRAIIEAVTMQALSGAMGPPTLDDLKDFDFSEEPFEDPLGIGLSWEEKYKKKKTDDEPAAAKAETGDGGGQ
jgi:His-Xaa-Ser system protein HxsD